MHSKFHLNPPSGCEEEVKKDDLYITCIIWRAERAEPVMNFNDRRPERAETVMDFDNRRAERAETVMNFDDRRAE